MGVGWGGDQVIKILNVPKAEDSGRKRTCSSKEDTFHTSPVTQN